MVASVLAGYNNSPEGHSKSPDKVVANNRDLEKLNKMRDHVQIKMKEINLDLQTVNTSRIQLVKTDSHKPGSFSVASSGGNHKVQQRPSNSGLSNFSPNNKGPKHELRRPESQLLMSKSPTDRNEKKKLDSIKS